MPPWQNTILFVVLNGVFSLQLSTVHGAVDSSVSQTKTLQRLPQAIIIGVKKGGTRALLEYLRLHPNIRAPGPEVHFFDRYHDRGLDWYRSQMPPTTDDQMTIEKTPSYFVKREVPARIHRMSPAIKLIVVVRDPTTRAISDYTQSFSKGRTRKLFDQMLFHDNEQTKIYERWSAVRIGLYAKHLKKWLPYFPLEQIHFVSGEALISNPVTEMRAVERFLGLPSFINDNHFNFNATKGFPCVKRRQTDTDFRCLGATKGRTHPSLSTRTLQLLNQFYAPHNKLFYEMTGRDFGWSTAL